MNSEAEPASQSQLGWQWLASFQHLQALHDEKYQANAKYPLFERLSDQLFHLVKYNGKLASSAWSSKATPVREKLLADAIIVATSMANTLDIDLGHALRRQGMTHLENWHPIQDLVDWLQDNHHSAKSIKSRSDLDLAPSEFIIHVTLPRLLAAIARCLSGTQRLKSLDYRTILSNSVVDYWCSCLILHRLTTPAPFTSAVSMRLTALERQYPRHAWVGLYNQRYEVPNPQEAADGRDALLASMALGPLDQEAEKEEKKN